MNNNLRLKFLIKAYNFFMGPKMLDGVQGEHVSNQFSSACKVVIL